MLYKERELTLFVPFTITAPSDIYVYGNINEVTALHLASYSTYEVGFGGNSMINPIPVG